MAMDINVVGGVSNNKQEVNSAGQGLVITETDVAGYPGRVGGSRSFQEVDSGALTGTPSLTSPEPDVDFRLRVALDALLDEELFNYTAQNTGKHTYTTTTMTNSWTAGQLTTNSANITTTTTGTILQTYAYFPSYGAQTLSADCVVAFTAQPTTNTFIEFGFCLPGTSTTAPTDGVFLRLSAAGLQGISSYNGTETSTGVFPAANGTGTWSYTNNKRYQFIIYWAAVEADFWVNDGTSTYLLGTIKLPTAQPRMAMASSLPYVFKHRITGGAAGGAMQALLGSYNVRLGGNNTPVSIAQQGNRAFGSYQGLSGGTMGTLANYANSANPTAAVPTNTTAALGTGLGGQFWETDTLAATTDGIICSYQVPAGTANVQGRRLVVTGVKISGSVQTALTGGGYIAQWSLAFGHTALSLATAEAATTKAPRRVALGQHAVTSAAAAATMLTDITMDFSSAPIYVNPGEFVALVRKKVGTAPSAGVISHVITFVYGWE